MSANLTVFVNTTTTDSSKATAPGNFTEVDPSADQLIFSAGSDVVIDGATLSGIGESELNQAATLITTSDVDVAHYFLADNDANLLKEIDNMGAKNKQFVMCFSFDDATASEPVLEVWDDIDMDSFLAKCLGEGVATNSWYNGICTTDSEPGSDDWSGNTLAGSAANHFIWLNNENGALGSAADLYINFRVIVPASFGSSGAETPIFVCKYTTN